MGLRPRLRPKQSPVDAGEKVTCRLDDATRAWLRPWTGRGLANVIRDLVRDAGAWFTLPAPVVVALEADLATFGALSQRDYLLAVLLMRARQLGVGAAGLAPYPTDMRWRRQLRAKQFSCVLDPDTRTTLRLTADDHLPSALEAVIHDARCWFGLSPSVAAALDADRLALGIDSQRGYCVWLLLQRAHHALKPQARADEVVA